jgi:hypothetical protein
MARFFREDFDRRREFVVTREFTFAGQRLLVGQRVNKATFTDRRLRQLYDLRYLQFDTVARPAPVAPSQPSRVVRYRSRKIAEATA